MKALTVWQPYASLTAYGVKHFETRGWQTPYRGPIAIHAARRIPEWEWTGAAHRSVVEAWARAGCDAVPHILAVEHGAVNVTLSMLPLGAVVAVAELADIRAADPAGVSDIEALVGSWTLARFAWRLENVRRLPTPVPVVGRQRLFDIEGDALAAVRAQLGVLG